MNYWLLGVSLFHFVASLLHLSCVVFGGKMFRFLGAGEYIATLSDKGHWYPPFIATIIAIMLAGFGVYALSAVGVVRALPYPKLVLMGIGLVFVLRAVAFPLIRPLFPENSLTFWLISSAICLFVGLAHWIGVYYLKS